MSYYVSEHAAWADKIFRRFVNLRTDYQKLEHQRDPSQPLTARQQWKLTDLSYLKSFYKQGRSARGAAGGTSRTSTEHDSDEEADDRGHESSASSRKETPTKIPVLNLPMPSRRPKKRRDDRTDSDRDETSSKLNEIVDIMKNSPSHLVGSSQTVLLDQQEQERVSFFQWMFESTRRMPRGKWREFQTQAFHLSMAFSTAESPQGNPSRARISQGSSTSSSHADHGQYPMNPPARPPPPASDGFVELLQAQPTEMVSNFLLSFCKCFTVVINLFCVCTT